MNTWTKALIVLCIVLTVLCLYLTSEVMLKRPQIGRYQLGTYSTAAIVLDTTTGNAWIVVTHDSRFKMHPVDSPSK